MTALQGALFNRLRFSVWLPQQLLCGLVAIATMGRVAAAIAATGAASHSTVMLCGAVYHMTLGIVLPGAVVWELERRERARFLLQHPAQARAATDPDSKLKAA